MERWQWTMDPVGEYERRKSIERFLGRNRSALGAVPSDAGSTQMPRTNYPEAVGSYDLSGSTQPPYGNPLAGIGGDTGGGSQIGGLLEILAKQTGANAPVGVGVDELRAVSKNNPFGLSNPSEYVDEKNKQAEELLGILMGSRQQKKVKPNIGDILGLLAAAGMAVRGATASDDEVANQAFPAAMQTIMGVKQGIAARKAEQNSSSDQMLDLVKTMNTIISGQRSDKIAASNSERASQETNMAKYLETQFSNKLKLAQFDLEKATQQRMTVEAIGKEGEAKRQSLKDAREQAVQSYIAESLGNYRNRDGSYDTKRYLYDVQKFNPAMYKHVSEALGAEEIDRTDQILKRSDALFDRSLKEDEVGPYLMYKGKKIYQSDPTYQEVEQEYKDWARYQSLKDYDLAPTESDPVMWPGVAPAPPPPPPDKGNIPYIMEAIKALGAGGQQF